MPLQSFMLEVHMGAIVQLLPVEPRPGDAPLVVGGGPIGLAVIAGLKLAKWRRASTVIDARQLCDVR